MGKDTAVPKEYLVDLGRTSYRGGHVPNIREPVYKAFSPEQALGFVLMKHGLKGLRDALMPEAHVLATEVEPDELSDPQPLDAPVEPAREYIQPELFDVVEGDGFTLVRPRNVR